MGADLHIHVATEDLLEELKKFRLKTGWSSEIGNFYTEALVEGKWVHENDLKDEDWGKIEKTRDVPVSLDEDAIFDTPNVWVGEVSWLKAMIFNDKETFIPATVEQVRSLVWEPTIINPALIEKVKEAFSLPNNTKKEGGVFGGEGYRLANQDEVTKFLTSHIGQYAFCISW